MNSTTTLTGLERLERRDFQQSIKKAGYKIVFNPYFLFTIYPLRKEEIEEYLYREEFSVSLRLILIFLLSGIQSLKLYGTF